jgi:uncharacterized protein YprB with RNaseH-like and TPR domain
LIKRDDWWHDKRIAYFDIEASDLTANWGMMLSWCIKYRGDDKIREGVITKKEIFDFKFDKRIFEELMEELKNVDILVTYYGTGFDIPFARTRTLYHGLEFPAYGSMYHWDLFYKVRSKLKTHRKSLEVVTKFYGIEGKTHLEPDMMFKAQYGHPEAMKQLLHHNREDVIILEKLHDLLWSHSKWIRTSI